MAEAITNEVFVKKTERLAFYGVPGTDGSVTYHRMKGFDKLEKSDNPQEYSRTYVDEEFERTDVTGYKPEFSCSFDQIVGNAVHDDILSIVDDEIVGSAAVRSILVVDLAKESSDTKGSYEARLRNVTVLGDSETRENLYNRSIVLKTNGGITKGMATTMDEWQTATFTENE